MNPFAYRTTSLAIKTLSNLSKARFALHDTDRIPKGSKIFVINHFTRLETVLMPFYLNRLVHLPIWSLAAPELFIGAFGRMLTSLGAVSTSAPDRDRLIVKSLLTNEAAWVIFPEGRMVKSKKIIEKGRFIVQYAGGKHPPHTGAAYLAMRTEFYRQRLLRLMEQPHAELERLLPKFNLPSAEVISRDGTFIVPVNVTYYPLRARINILNRLAQFIVENVPERMAEELMTEGSMLISGVDIDVCFGEPIDVASFLNHKKIQQAIGTPQPFDFDDPLPCVSCMRRTALQLTQRYMQAIYGMTTVNHDHIFASLLKHSPTNVIDPEDFRRRAFLAISRDAARDGVHLHGSMREKQNHLLIDDCYGKVADFMSIAEEKGVIARQGPYLIRDRRKLSGIFDFHRIRIDNPVAVSANEVEPLESLQKKIRSLARQPGFWVRSSVARYLIAAAEQEFKQDYEQFCIQGESKPMSVGKPILVQGRWRRMGVLLVHGYMAAPEEVRELAEYLGRQGMWVYAPRLKGHGTSPEDLAQRSYKEWIQSVEEGYLAISHLCRQVVLGGFSTGAALALELASRVPRAAGVFAVSTPLRLQYMGSRLAPLVDSWNRLMERVHWEDGKKEFVENHPENPDINYKRNPVAGVRELERLMDYLEPRLPGITMPALVVQSQEDPVVDPRGSQKIFEDIGSVDKQYLVFNFNRHGIIRGKGSRRVHQAISLFIQGLGRQG